MKKLMKSYNNILIEAVKCDLEGNHRDATYLFGEASGMLHMAYIMYDTIGSEVTAKMSRASVLAYDIVMGDVEDEKESLWILENNMA